MHRFLLASTLCLALGYGPALAQEQGGQDADGDAAISDDSLMVDPAFSDDPNAVVVAEPTAAEREAAVAAARGPDTAQGSGANLRGLDKVTGRTIDFDLVSGEAREFGRLELRLGECRYPAKNPAADAFVELTVTDKRANRTIFSGWMIASSPALSALDDPRYDVWAMSCNRA